MGFTYDMKTQDDRWEKAYLAMENWLVGWYVRTYIFLD